MCALVRRSQAPDAMKLRTAASAWRTTFLASLGLAPLVACSSNDQGSNVNAGSTGGVPATGGSTSAGGASSGGSPNGAGGAQQTGGAAGKAAAGGTSAGSTGGAGGSAGGAGGGVAAGGSSVGGADAGPDAADAGRLACRNPMPRLGPDGKPTGFVDCEGGFTHRPEKRTCGSSAPRSTACTSTVALSGCSHDSDCKDHPLGYCNLGNGPMGATCACAYGCSTDAECATGQICGCSDPAGACVPTQNCTSDADCGPGLLCITSSDGGCGFVFACQTPKDTCASSADCDVSSMCAFVGDHHECAPHRPCSTGRPFLVEGHARVAPVVTDRAWASNVAPCVDELDGAALGALAAHWTEIALMEHASIAAFARFALELLSLGAPPDLLALTHSALADETVHARDAFALASAYAGQAIGPGPLSLEGAIHARSLADVVEITVLEGCIGETIAALEATEALASATDPAAVAALSRVAKDEARHAELAYRFVRWALEVSPGPARKAMGQRILALIGAESSDATEEAPRDTDAPLLARHGLLPAHTRAQIRRLALSEVVRPCLGALVAQVASDVERGAFRAAEATPAGV
jgi:hypothetical protein